MFLAKRSAIRHRALNISCLTLGTPISTLQTSGVTNERPLRPKDLTITPSIQDRLGASTGTTVKMAQRSKDLRGTSEIEALIQLDR